MTRDEKLSKLQTLLISAKVSLEYGMGFSRNQYLIFAMKDLERAMEVFYTVYEFEEDEYEGV